jgi:hypothetical protein
MKQDERNEKGKDKNVRFNMGTTDWRYHCKQYKNQIKSYKPIKQVFARCDPQKWHPQEILRICINAFFHKTII